MLRLSPVHTELLANAMMLIILAGLLPIAASAQQTSDRTQSAPYTFNITTREVVVDVIAIGAHDRPVTDLAPADLQVFNVSGKSQGMPQPITSLRLVDLSSASASADTEQPGFHLNIAATCLDHATPHYLLAFHPGADGWTGGSHQVLIKTSRRGVRLFYRHSYYVGATTPLPENEPDKLSAPRLAQLAEQLRQAACYHSDVPLSVSVRARLIDTGRSDVLRYGVSVDPDSLAFISLSDNGRRVQLDYGVCNFDENGQPVDYLHGSLDQVLTPLEYERALAHGFPHLIDFPAPAHLGLTRFVVRDLVTGNIGSADVVFPAPELPQPPGPELTQSNKDDRMAVESALATRASVFWNGAQIYVRLPQGPIGSFGSVIRSSNSFCGDVFEIPSETPHLPDFRDYDPIGSIYTASLNVPDQQFDDTNGIPGVTARTVGFGIDYRARFWVRAPGEYEFEMLSDDGAILQIDDKRVIDLDGLHQATGTKGRILLDPGSHTMHIPYYQGEPNAVALVLWVKAPGGDWKVFDLNDFPPNSVH